MEKLCQLFWPNIRLMLALIMMKFLSLLLLFLFTLPACEVIQDTTGFKTSSSSTLGATTYDINQTITLVNEGPQKPEKQNLWVALISDQTPYQKVLSQEIQPSNYVIVTDEFGNRYAEFDFKDLDPGISTQINIKYQVTVNELSFDLGDCKGDLPDEYTKAELHIESSNPQIISLAEELSIPAQTPCEQVRAFYNYIGNNLVYTYNGQDWGAQAALGSMGTDCTEYSSLLIALSRASGIPARYVEGLLHLNQKDPAQVRKEHAWVEIYMPGTGWVPVDPTLGRSSLTREKHFARYTPNHIIVTNGRNPSTLRGASYWSHLYWPGDSTTIRVQEASWTIIAQ
jgi:transglutaminase-like putative cysteine protease